MGLNEWLALIGALGGLEAIKWVINFYVNRKTNARKEGAAADSMENENERKEAYAKFQEALAETPAYTFFCYIDALYAAENTIQGIDEDTVLGHHGVGIFWNICDWTIENQ